MSAAKTPNPMQEAEPAWDIARLFPPQGQWSEAEYLDLAARTNRLIELADGRVELLPMPNKTQQLLIWYLMDALRDFVRPRNLGSVLFAGLPVRLASRRFREPDVIFMSAENAARQGEEYWEGADLAMEVVSKNDPDRDYETKRQEYAEAEIPEYWIVDPRKRVIIVLTLSGDNRQYRVSGEYKPGQRAVSLVLPGFEVDVTAAFKAAESA